MSRAAKPAKRAPAPATAPVVVDLSYIHADLRPFAVPIADLALDPRNARLHDDRNLQAIADSLKAHGQVIPIVVQKQGMIVRAGNGRCLALKEMGRTHVAALVVEASDVDAIAFALRDNRTSELAKWDFEALSEHMKRLTTEGLDLTTVGWSEQEFGPLMEAEWNPPPPAPLESKPTRGTGDKRTLRAYEVTEEQATIIDGAIAAIREKEQDERIMPGRALELICADFVSGYVRNDAAES